MVRVLLCAKARRDEQGGCALQGMLSKGRALDACEAKRMKLLDLCTRHTAKWRQEMAAKCAKKGGFSAKFF